MRGWIWLGRTFVRTLEVLLRSATMVIRPGLALSTRRNGSTYDHYVREARALLKERQEQLTKDYDLGEWERYDWNQDRQELVGTPKVIAKVQFVGSYSKLSNTWRWAWANDTVLPDVKTDIVRVKQLGVEKRWSQLSQPQWSGTQRDGWDMTGVALRVLDARGAYRSPDENGRRSWSSQLFGGRAALTADLPQPGAPDGTGARSRVSQ
jgi:hypothetical protein